MDKSKSYADVATPNKYKTVVNDWPDLKNRLKQTGAGKSPDELNPTLNTLTNAMERLSTDDVQPMEKSHKSKEEIRADRQARRKIKQNEKVEKRFQEKVAQIREPKSQKVQVVDKRFMETYLLSQKASPIKDRRQSKSKNHSAVKIDLLDLINAKVVKPIDRTSIRRKETNKSTSVTQRHKGKKSEIQKKKYVSKIKRSILLSRVLRRQVTVEVNSETNDKGLDDLSDPQCSDKLTLESTPDNKSIVLTTLTTSPSIEPSGVQFSRKFRPYCDNLTSTELLSLTEALLRDIFRFQDRAYNKNEIKGRSQRRYVVGFKECMRQLDIAKVKLLIIAPDLEQSTETGGITETIEEMKMKCQKSEVPYVFSLKRRQLGYVLLKKVPVSCVGILNYQGSEENSQKLLQSIQEARLRFQSAVANPSEKNS